MTWTREPRSILSKSGIYPFTGFVKSRLIQMTAWGRSDYFTLDLPRKRKDIRPAKLYSRCYLFNQTVRGYPHQRDILVFDCVESVVIKVDAMF